MAHNAISIVKIQTFYCFRELISLVAKSITSFTIYKMKKIFFILSVAAFTQNSFAQVCFFTHTEYSVGTNTNTKNLTYGDFNNDGKQDIAVALVTPSLVSIILGNGDGTFAAANTYTANTQPYAICSADFNNDGKADVAVANNGTFQGMSVLLGNGLGGLGAPTSYAAGTNPAGIACGLFNNDANVDIAVTNFNNAPGTISVYMGSGSGTFAAAVTYTVGASTNPSGIVAKDVNNDTKTDLVTSNVGGDNVTVFLNNGSGGFYSAGSFSAGAATDPRDLTICDLNNDNKPDVITANNLTSNVSVLLGQGNGQFLGPNSYLAGNSPWGITNGDFNGDGTPDIAVSNLSSSTVSVLRGDGVGGLMTTQNFASGTGSVKVVAADFNGDGKKDIATANQNVASNNASILLNSLPGPMTITGNATICSGKTATLSASGAGNYSWASGQSTSSIAVSPTASGTYSVTGSNTGCVVTATGAKAVTVNSLPPVTANASTASVTVCTNTSVTLTGGGAVSYTWSGGINNGIGFVPTSNASYTVTGTDGNSCTNTASVAITMVPPAAPSICLVTVDSLSDYNIIAWEKGSMPQYDSMVVYRETSTNIYKPLGAVSFDSLSRFIDTVRTKYFPNTGNPNAGTYAYKIQVRDTCGNYSTLSPYHNTIFITNSVGNFSWPQHYRIEGSPNPVNNYMLLRDNLSDGNWDTIGAVAGTQQNISDPQYGLYQATASWRVGTLWNISCGLTIKNPVPMASNLNLSKSNINRVISPTSVSAILNNSSLNIYPNPTKGKFSVEWSGGRGELRIYNILGKEVAVGSKQLTSNSQVGIDISSEPKGVYFLKVKTQDGIVVKKIIKE